VTVPATDRPVPSSTSAGLESGGVCDSKARVWGEECNGLARVCI
jgi:hypothetical protein